MVFGLNRKAVSLATVAGVAGLGVLFWRTSPGDALRRRWGLDGHEAAAAEAQPMRHADFPVMPRLEDAASVVCQEPLAMHFAAPSSLMGFATELHTALGGCPALDEPIDGGAVIQVLAEGTKSTGARWDAALVPLPDLVAAEPAHMAGAPRVAGLVGWSTTATALVSHGPLGPGARVAYVPGAAGHFAGLFLLVGLPVQWKAAEGETQVQKAFLAREVEAAALTSHRTGEGGEDVVVRSAPEGLVPVVLVSFSRAREAHGPEIAALLAGVHAVALTARPPAGWRLASARDDAAFFSTAAGLPGWPTFGELYESASALWQRTQVLHTPPPPAGELLSLARKP